MTYPFISACVCVCACVEIPPHPSPSSPTWGVFLGVWERNFCRTVRTESNYPCVPKRVNGKKSPKKKRKTLDIAPLPAQPIAKQSKRIFFSRLLERKRGKWGNWGGGGYICPGRRRHIYLCMLYPGMERWIYLHPGCVWAYIHIHIHIK